MKKRVKGKSLIILILGTLFVAGFIRQEIALNRIEKEISKKQLELDELTEKNKALEDKIKIADTDEYIETLARERLDMVKPGEEIIKNKKGDSSSEN